jgi:type VI protein secretion system component VasF
VFFYCLCLGFKGQFYRPGDSARLNKLIKDCGDELISVDDDVLLFPRAYPARGVEEYHPPQRAANWQPLYVGLPLVLLAGLYIVFQNDIVTVAQAFLMMV